MPRPFFRRVLAPHIPHSEKQRRPIRPQLPFGDKPAFDQFERPPPVNPFVAHCLAIGDPLGGDLHGINAALLSNPASAVIAERLA